MNSIHKTTKKTPEKIKVEKISAIKARIMNFKSSHQMIDSKGNPIQYEELTTLENILAEAEISEE